MELDQDGLERSALVFTDARRRKVLHGPTSTGALNGVSRWLPTTLPDPRPPPDRPHVIL